MGQTPWSAVINLSNSIIGVSVLAMPWCFKECGVVLAISLLLITGFVNKFSCNLLLRSSKATRKTSYETLSNHTLGGMGKLAVEVSVILLLMCTCIAFFVIIGDLGPSLVSKFAGVENTSNLRTAILLGVAVFIILPLAQKRNVESLSALSTISICFYFFFATSVFIDSLPTLISLKWINTVEFWRPAGILKGMSIFALSMCCQPTLFAIYNSLQERTPKMMEDVVSKGVNLVAFVYMSIGFFGYITYYQEGIKGDILLNQPTSMVSDGLKLSFALSVALSFPLCVFPCRASIFSLLFPNADSNPITGMTYIPPTMFRVITVVILGITLTIAILVPNVEVVLSLTGSTMGSLACFILPALIYQHTVGVPARFMPKVLLIIGFCFMLVSTYDNIRPAPQDHRIPAPLAVDKLGVEIQKPVDVPVDGDREKQVVGVNKPAENLGLQGDDVIKDKVKDVNVGDIMAVDKIGKDTGEEQPRDKDKGGGDEKRQEPPIPHAPVEDDNKDKVVEDIVKVGEEKKEKEDKEDVEVEIPAKKVEKEDEVEEAPKEKEKKIAEEGKEEEGEKEAAEIVDDGAVAKKESKEKEAVEEAEEKLKAQEEKQEIQEKKLEELQARQVIQERLIVKQAEELDQLRKEHEEEKQKDEALQNAAAQLVQAQAAQQAMGQVPQQPAVGGLQQPAGPGVAVQPVQPVVGGQQVVGQPVVGQVGDQQVLGQLGVQQPVQPLVQGAGQLPVGQAAGQLQVGQVGGQPVMGQPAGQLPLGQAVGQLPVAQQAVGQLPVAQQPVAQLPVAQQPVGQLPVGQDVGQLPVGQGAGQLPLGQAAVQPLPGQQLAGQGQQQLQGQLGQQQQMAAGQQVGQVGMQPLPKMVSMFPQGAGGMGQNLAVQQGGGGVGAQHVGVEGINPIAGMGGVLPQQQQQQQQLMQGGVGQQGVLLDGMLPAGGGDGALGQANVMQQQQQYQANVAQQNPLALQQQQQQQLLPQQQQEQLVMQQQQVPVQQNQQQLPQQGMVGAGDGMARAGFADMNQPQGDAVVVEGGIPQQPLHLEPADKMVKSLDKDAILEPGKDRAGVQQRVLNQAGAEGDKEGEKQKKKHKDEQKEGGKEGESDGVIQVVDEEKAEEDEGMGGGNGDAVPAPVEKEGGPIGDHKKTDDKALINTKNKKIEDKKEEDAEKGIDGEAKKEEEEEGEENGEKEPVNDDSETQEDQLQGTEDKLLENHLKMIENEEEEEFADQENVGLVDVKDEQDADVAVVMKDADDEGKIEMNQEQKEHLEKKNIRSREEV